MSLVCWLPLDGNLRNQGCSNVTVTNNGATVNTSGKIGSCYAFNGSTGYIALSGNDIFNIFTGGTQQFSITMWVFHADTTRAILFGDYSTTGGIGFNIELSTGHGVRFYWNGSPDTYPSNATVAASAWSHLALTYDGTKIQSYINGIAKGSWTGTLATKNKTSGEFRLGRDNRSDSTAFNGRMNDFRIYDHCLSAAEVHEISQGLVLHYKLDSFQGGYGNPNIIVTHSNAGVDGTGTTGWSSAGTGWANSFVTAEGATGGYAIRCTYSGTSQTSGGIHHSTGVDKTTLTTGDIYTLSARIRTSKTCVVTFQNELMTTGHSINATTEWQVYTYTCAIDTSKTYQSNVMYVRAADAVQNMWIECDWIKLEKGTAATPWQPSGVIGTAIQDSSGYGHNGTITGNVSLTANTARYNAAAIFSGYQNPTIDAANPSFLSAMINCTVTWWEYVTVTGNNLPIRGQDGSHYIGAGSTSTNLYHSNAGDSGVLYINGVAKTSTVASPKVTSSYKYEQNKWVHFAFTNANLSSWTKFQLNNYSSNWPVNGYISDVRVYATALSAADIKQLYEVGTKVDNLHNLHTFEYIENSPTIKLTKQGSLKEGEIQENTVTKFYKANSIIKAKNFIEA